MHYGEIIHRIHDDSYVITKDGLPYHVPHEEDFLEEWAEVRAYAEAHPEMVTEEEPWTPPVPTLEDAKAAKIAEIAAGYDAAMTATLTMPAEKPSPAEIALATLDFQLEDAEGLAYVRGLLAACRDELLAAVDVATGCEDVDAIAVIYPV